MTTRRMGRFAGGVNNVDDLHDLTPGDKRLPQYLADAVNVDLDDSGKPTRRRGTRLVHDGGWSALWSEERIQFALGVRDGVLHFITELNRAVAIRPLAPCNDSPSYALLNDKVYWSDGQQTGVVTIVGEALPWGLPDPGEPFVSPRPDGGMLAGRYRLAITYMDAAGTESGASESVDLVLAAGDGFTLDLPLVPPGVAAVQVYLSEANGEHLLRAHTLPGPGVFALGASTPGKLLETQFYERVPPATIVRSYRARLFLAIDDTLFYTDPLRYGLIKRADNYIRFPDPVLMVEAVDDGIFVGTQHAVFYLGGADPKAFTNVVADPSGVVAGTSMRARASVFAFDGVQGEVAVWWSRLGRFVVATNGGGVTFPTQNRLALPEFASGATALRERDGARHFVTRLTGGGEGSSFAAADYADAVLVSRAVKR